MSQFSDDAPKLRGLRQTLKFPAVMLFITILSEGEAKESSCCFIASYAINIYVVLMTGEPYRDTDAEEVHGRTIKKKERPMIRLLEKTEYPVTKC